jgi:hypothetical protein
MLRWIKQRRRGSGIRPASDAPRCTPVTLEEAKALSALHLCCNLRLTSRALAQDHRPKSSVSAAQPCAARQLTHPLSKLWSRPPQRRI